MPEKHALERSRERDSHTKSSSCGRANLRRRKLSTQIDGPTSPAWVAFTRNDCSSPARPRSRPALIPKLGRRGGPYTASDVVADIEPLAPPPSTTPPARAHVTERPPRRGSPQRQAAGAFGLASRPVTRRRASRTAPHVAVAPPRPRSGRLAGACARRPNGRARRTSPAVQSEGQLEIELEALLLGEFTHAKMARWEIRPIMRRERPQKQASARAARQRCVA